MRSYLDLELDSVLESNLGRLCNSDSCGGTGDNDYPRGQCSALRQEADDFWNGKNEIASKVSAFIQKTIIEAGVLLYSAIVQKLIVL